MGIHSITETKTYYKFLNPIIMNTKLILIAITIFSVFQLQAQETTNQTEKSKNEFQKVFKIEPINLLLDEIVFGYEQQISKKGSLEFNAAYENTNAILVGGPTFKIHSVKLNAGYRHYITKKEDRLQGIYARAGIEGNHIFAKEVDGIYIGAVDAHLGYQWVLPKFLKGLTFDVNIGADISRQLNGDFAKERGTLINLDLNIGIGYSF